MRKLRQQVGKTDIDNDSAEDSSLLHSGEVAAPRLHAHNLRIYRPTSQYG